MSKDFFSYMAERANKIAKGEIGYFREGVALINKGRSKECLEIAASQGRAAKSDPHAARRILSNLYAGASQLGDYAAKMMQESTPSSLAIALSKALDIKFTQGTAFSIPKHLPFS